MGNGKTYIGKAQGTDEITKARIINVAGPFDVRTVVDTYDDLFAKSTFNYTELYVGMMVITADTQDVYVLSVIPGSRVNATQWPDLIVWKKVNADSLDYYKENLSTKVVESLNEVENPYPGQLVAVTGSSEEENDGLYVYTQGNAWINISPAKGNDGADGADGKDGVDGLSAYEIAIAGTDESEVPSEEEWVASLKGADGKDGQYGVPGLSAYELAIANLEGSDVPTEEEWLESLKATMSDEDKAKIDSIPDVNTLATKEDIEDVVREEELEDYTSKEELVERIGIVGQEVESNVYEYIYDKASWEASYADGVLKEYYELYPNEDLWNFDTNSAPGFNDKIYTCEVYTDAACEGEYEVKQFHAQWYSDNGVQRIYDVDDPITDYYIPTFFDTPTQIFELFAGAEGGYVATPDDLVYPAGKWIKVKEVSFGGPNVRPAWEAAVQAPGAQFPWIALKVENVENQIVKFEYEGKDPVYPWGEKRFGLGGKSWGIASVAKEWEENGFLIQENANNGEESWSNDENGFDISKFKLVLVTPSSVKDYVDAAIAGIELTPGENGVDGADGKDGVDGLSAYEIAIAGMDESEVPSEEEWVASLNGVDGKDGKDGADGKDGENGLSAYELAMLHYDGSEQPTEEEWLESLKAVMSDEDRAKIDSIPAEGSFPADSELEDEPVDGFATVQDVMDYVDALFEKKKEELAEPDYLYVNGIRYAENAIPTSIYQMNPFEIDDDMLQNGLEVLVGPEILGYDGGPDDPATVYTTIFSIDVPDGYSIEVHGWDGIASKYYDAVDPVMSNPKYSTKQYGSKNYTCYVRFNTDAYDDATNVETRYKILISKNNPIDPVQ